MNREKIFKKITEKWPVKVLSLVAAVVISVFYRMNSLETRSFSVPLQVISNDNFIPVNTFINTVRINLRGETNEILTILEQDIEAYIDLNRYTGEGTYRVPVQIRKKGSSLGVEPLEITVVPIEIPIQLEEIINRNINIIPDERGQIASGYDLISRTFTPESVMAEGPRSILEKHSGFTTGIIDLEGRFENFTVLVNIINDNPHITIRGTRMLEYHGNIRRIEYTRAAEETYVLNFPEDNIENRDLEYEQNLPEENIENGDME